MKKKRNTSRRTYQLVKGRIERHCRQMMMQSQHLHTSGSFPCTQTSSERKAEPSEVPSCVGVVCSETEGTSLCSSDECGSVRSFVRSEVLESERVEASESNEDEDDICGMYDSDCSSCKETDLVLEDQVQQQPQCNREETLHLGLHEDIITNLRKWAIENQVTLCSLGKLLQILKPSFPDLPLDPKTLLRSGKRSNQVEAMGDGSYYNFGLKECIEKRILLGQIKQSTISLNINIDSVPLFKSIGTCFMPVLCLINNSRLPPFISAIYCGPGKPDIKIFLKDFAPELDELLDSGIQIDNKNYQVEINCFVCDAPARAYVKCMIGHTGYFACERCTQRGKSVGRMTFPDLNASLRSDESFACYIDERHHNDMSPLTDIGVLMVSQFPLEYMHLVCLGIMRNLLLKWTKNKRKYALSVKILDIIGNLMLVAAKSWPSDFNRKPRKLNELKRWKATELRQFLLYLGPVILKNYLPKCVFDHFILLHVAITIFVREDLHKCLHSEATELLRDFVRIGSTPEHYGETFSVYNVHSLIHIGDDVRKFGALDNYSAFVFENELQHIKHLVRGKSKPLQQLINRVTEIENNIVSNPVSKENGIIFSLQTNNGITAGLHCGNSFSRCVLHEKVFSIKDGDNFAMLIDSSIIKIINFYRNNDGDWVIGKRFVQYSDLYVLPLKSSDLGIFVAEKLSDLPRKYPLQKIRYKCVAVPFERMGTFAFYPLVN